jgi:hypothetical protein
LGEIPLFSRTPQANILRSKLLCSFLVESGKFPIQGKQEQSGDMSKGSGSYLVEPQKSLVTEITSLHGDSGFFLFLRYKSIRLTEGEPRVCAKRIQSFTVWRDSGMAAFAGHETVYNPHPFFNCSVPYKLGHNEVA